MKPTGTKALGPFVVLAYTLTWLLLGPFFYVLNVRYDGQMPTWLWAWVPLAFLGGWGPTLAGLIVTARIEGRHGVKRLLRSVVDWRVPARWYLLVLFFPPAVTALAVIGVDRGLARFGDFDAGAALVALPVAYLLALPFGPLGEEVGWRGFALPRLMARYGPARASLVLGAIWTFWHVPMMLWSPGASIPSFMELSAFAVAVYLVQITSETVLITWLFLRTRGSLLLAVLAHLTFNTAESVVYGGLPDPAVEHERAVYLVHVGLLAAIALVALMRRPRFPEAFYRHLREHTLIGIKVGHELLRGRPGQARYGDETIAIEGRKLPADSPLMADIDRSYLERFTQPENLSYARGISRPEYHPYPVEIVARRQG